MAFRRNKHSHSGNVDKSSCFDLLLIANSEEDRYLSIFSIEIESPTFKKTFFNLHKLADFLNSLSENYMKIKYVSRAISFSQVTRVQINIYRWSNCCLEVVPLQIITSHEMPVERLEPVSDVERSRTKWEKYFAPKLIDKYY